MQDRDDEEETPEQRVRRYRQMYDVDTLAQMCVDAEEAYSKVYDELSLLKAKKRRATPKRSERGGK